MSARTAFWKPPNPDRDDAYFALVLFVMAVLAMATWLR